MGNLLFVDIKLFVAFPLGSNQTTNKPVLPGWFMICVYVMTGAPKGSPKVILWRSLELNLWPLVYKAYVYPLHQGESAWPVALFSYTYK